jgi:hypothetical protein
MLTKFSESTVVKTKTNSQQIVNNESPDSQRRFDKNETVDYSTPEQMDVSGDSQQLLATGGGVCVSTNEFTEVNTPELSHDGWGEVVRTEAIVKHCCFQMPLEQTTSTAADESEEVIEPADAITPNPADPSQPVEESFSGQPEKVTEAIAAAPLVDNDVANTMSIEVESIQVGDRVRFTNPDKLPKLRHLEALDLEVVSVNQTILLATCRLPSGTAEPFGLRTLRKIE